MRPTQLLRRRSEKGGRRMEIDATTDAQQLLCEEASSDPSLGKGRKECESLSVFSDYHYHVLS
jgi:hypothetical protein